VGAWIWRTVSKKPAVAHDGVGQENLGGRGRTLRRVRYREPPEGGVLGSGTGQKCVSSPVADDVESLPANGRKTEAPPPAVETCRCDGCDADFRPPAHGRAFAALPAGCGLLAPLASET